MHITFEDIQKQSNIQTAAKNAAAEKIAVQAGRMGQGASKTADGIRTDLFGQSAQKAGVFAYGREKSVQDVQQEASLADGSAYKNYMAVMSHTMSEEDYKELTKEGVHPGSVDVKDAVTIMDHIKANMAESGVIIEGFNASGDIPLEKLEEITGDAGYAQAIAHAFSQNDIPLTQENVKNTMEAVAIGDKLTSLGEDMKQYLLENELPPTIDNLYKAMYSVSGQMQNEQGGYFADDMPGYYGKAQQWKQEESTGESGEKYAGDGLDRQVEKMLQNADIPVTEETKKQAFFLLEKGILLTEENMKNLQALDAMKLPASREELLSAAAQAIRDGKNPMEASLQGESIVEQAQECYEALQEASDESLYALVESGRTIHIRNLSSVQKEISLSTQLYEEMHQKVNDPGAMSEEIRQTFTHERRMLEETRLKMTVIANILLLKSDYAIDTAPLSSLVEALKEAEERQRDYSLTLPDAEKTQLYRETMEKRADLFDMPAAVTARVMSVTDTFTLRHMHEEGSTLKSTYERAGESYEALMTKPRADLGDKIKDAFSNIDELLSKQDLEPNEENRRAVRILAYNQMALTKENMERVAAADQMVTRLLNQMTPAATLQMIRDGINPLDQTIPELTEYLNQQEDSLMGQAEKFGRFLYKLEQEKGISKEERDSFVGIYRLIRQVEKGDRRAIGRVVDDGRELSFANLLSAVRTGQKKQVNLVIDDRFGALKDLEAKGVSISDQINSYFAIMENRETEEQYMNLQYEQFRQNMETPQEYVRILTESGQMVTADNLEAIKSLTQNRGELYRSIRGRLAEKKQQTPSAEGNGSESEKAGRIELPAFEELLGRMKEHFTDAQNAQSAAKEMTGRISSLLREDMYEGESDYLDIRAISSIAKQLSLVGRMAEQEIFELPAVIEGELTSVNVRFEKQDGGEQPNARVTIQLTDGKQIVASFTGEKDTIKGYIGCNDAAVKEKLEENLQNFYTDILSETGKKADIAIVQSDTLEQIRQPRKQIAGKQQLLQKQSQAEQNQGGEADAGALYQTVKSFVSLFE